MLGHCLEILQIHANYVHQGSTLQCKVLPVAKPAPRETIAPRKVSLNIHRVQLANSPIFTVLLHVWCVLLVLTRVIWEQSNVCPVRLVITIHMAKARPWQCVENVLQVQSRHILVCQTVQSVDLVTFRRNQARLLVKAVLRHSVMTH